ncbi:cyclic lactone autoinducer peptide [Lysinibacillus sp. NPDC094403]
MKLLLNCVFTLLYLIAKSEVVAASFFLIHEPKIPKQLSKMD